MSKRLLLSFLIVLFFYLKPDLATAQNIPDISTINIDNLSDQQLNQVLQQAHNNGLTDDQIVQQALSKGMSQSEASKLKSRISTLHNNGINLNSNDTTVSTSRKLNYSPDKDDTKGKTHQTTGLPVFGADLFKSSSTSFEPNLKIATPINYILGPDDQLTINVYGHSLVNWKLEVSPEGNINIPGVGILNVGGKTIEQATTAIKTRLAANNYAIGRGTNVQVSLGNIRSIKVIMVGQLEKPGTYTLPSLATVFNALYAAGGTNNNGSLRQIEIIRNNRILRRLDVYDFLVKGDQKNNIALEDQDIVRVPTYRTRVAMSGQVKISAYFEVLSGENLQDVINFAGGFTDSAYTARIKVSQISDQQRKLTDVFEADYKNYIPLRGDQYFVEPVLNRFENRVTINGAVFRPGDYELEAGLTLSQLIKKAAGLKEDAFMGRGSIVRLKPDNTTEQISFNVTDVINKTKDLALQREDVIEISSIFSLRDQYRVTIKGEIRAPGTFAYADSMSVADLIVKAGGFSEGASAKRIEVSRRVFDSDPRVKSSAVAQVFNVDIDPKLGFADAHFTLKPFDVVSVYTLPGFEVQKTIKVEGEVLYPGYYTIRKKNETISDIITRAGGLSAAADVDGGTLKRDNIAILGVDKNRVDTAAIAREQTARMNRLKQSFRDSTSNTPTDQQLRNNYVGIDLANILAKPGSSIDIIMEDGDIIRIPKLQQIVRVNGEVLFPSAVVYDKHKDFKGYVLNAGGYSPTALKRGAYVVYPNGTVKGTSKFLFFNSHPEVKPGSEIYIPKKPVHRGLSAGEVIGLSSGLASIAAVILGILSLHK
ncbi:SLBB domain-containing protein [Mucilaginibacter celer]|uniref:Capsule biosynthesis protein n=1 Tax=Mucilaginibacter celer TaxID=2305508 RepID=A0A494VN46_9SPHI|nr:SLBB domain-containing protein [Mucilaginibacter celer]AYL95131.1 capsule biosynthesis protein [Mucilaginibacter celer]